MPKPAKKPAKKPASKPKTSKPKTSKPKARPPSPYNKFMKEELPKYKKAHPSASHAQAFAGVAKQWATSPKNPKNK